MVWTTQRSSLQKRSNSAFLLGGSSAPTGDAKSTRLRSTFLTSSKPPSRCYDVPRGLLDPPALGSVLRCSGTRVACSKSAPTSQFAVIFTDRLALNRSSSQYERAFSVRFLLNHEMQTRRRANQGRERMQCDPWDSRLIVQPIRNNAAKTLRALAEPHWLMPRQPRKLSRSPETFRHARSARREHAVPELQRVILPAREYVRKPSPRVLGDLRDATPCQGDCSIDRELNPGALEV